MQAKTLEQPLTLSTRIAQLSYWLSGSRTSSTISLLFTSPSSAGGEEEVEGR